MNCVIWFTGLPSSGKTTLALKLKTVLECLGRNVLHIDGDVVRKGLCEDLGFSVDDRTENVRRIAHLSKLMMENDLCTVLVSLISPDAEARKMAKNIIGEDRFIEVFIHAPISECIRRDVKGLYEKAINGEIPNFTGISAPYDVPESPDIVIKTERMGETRATLKLMMDLYNIWSRQ